MISIYKQTILEKAERAQQLASRMEEKESNTCNRLTTAFFEQAYTLAVGDDEFSLVDDLADQFDQLWAGENIITSVANILRDINNTELLKYIATYNIPKYN